MTPIRLPSLFLLLTSIIYILIPVTAVNAQPTAPLPVNGFANSPGIAAFDQRFIPFLKKWRVPGAAVVVMKNGQVLVDRGYGWADKETATPVSSASLFRIASVSKTFTATTILKLVEQGKLRLDERVFDILNDIKPLNGRLINPQIYQMTVQNLLQMSSGWFTGGAGHFDPLFGPWPKGITALLSPELPASCETMTRLMMSQSLRYKPGSHYAYSNLDYCILGLVVNKVVGSHYGYSGYERYVQQQILAPIGINDMQIGSTQIKYRAANEVTYYRDPGSISPGELANSSYFPYSPMEILKKNFANGGWIASAKDLATFIQALNHGRIINSESLKVMQQKPPFVAKAKTSYYYAMGEAIDNSNGQRYLIQHGSFTGTNALIVTKPDGTTIATVFNYRPDASSFLTKFRPELRRLLITCDL